MYARSSPSFSLHRFVSLIVGSILAVFTSTATFVQEVFSLMMDSFVSPPPKPMLSYQSAPSIAQQQRQHLLNFQPPLDINRHYAWAR
jgi:hypothetical protein